MEKIERLLSCCTRLAVVYTSRLEDMAVLREKPENKTFETLINDIIDQSKPRFLPPQERIRISTVTKSNKKSFRKFKLKRSRRNRNRCVIFSSIEPKDHHKPNSPHSKLSINVEQKNIVDTTNDDAMNDSEKNMSRTGQKYSILQNYLSLCKPVSVLVTDIGKIVPKNISDENKFDVLSISSDDADDVPILTETVDDVPIPTEIVDNVSIPTKTVDNVLNPTETVDNVLNPTETVDNVLIPTEIVNNVPIPTETADNVLIPTETVNNLLVSTETVHNVSTKRVENIIISAKTTTDAKVFLNDQIRLKNLNDLNHIIGQDKLRNSLFVIYNSYCNDIDAYVISSECSLKNAFSMKYSQTTKLQIKNCNSVFNIYCCCYIKRQSFIQLLSTFKKYQDLARLMYRNHPCKSKQCHCCCIGEHFKNNNIKDIHIDVDNYSNNLEENNNSSSHATQLPKRRKKRTSKLISAALKYPMQLKKNLWKGNKKNENKICRKTYTHGCRKMFKLRDANGFEEIYELGPEDVVYSKIVTTYRPDSCWLSKTYTRDESIKDSRHINVKDCSLTMKSSFVSCLSNLKAPNVVGYANYYKKISYAEIFANMQALKSLIDKTASTLPKSNENAAEQTINQNINVMGNGESAVVRTLISDILQRFRNVHLTINANGQVAATLNAPLNTLSSSELTILSEILKYAQKQVDTLRLKPGTSFNSGVLLQNSLPPNNNNEINSVPSNNLQPNMCSKVSDSVNANFSDKNKRKASGTKATKKINTAMNSEVLSTFSMIICDKKKGYENSFCNYLKESVGLTPKIMNVFSINEDQSTSLITSATNTNNNLGGKPKKLSKNTINEKNHAKEETNNQQENIDTFTKNQASTSCKGKKRRNSSVSDSDVILTKVTKLLCEENLCNNVFEEEFIDPENASLIENLKERDPLGLDLEESCCDYFLVED